MADQPNRRTFVKQFLAGSALAGLGMSSVGWAAADSARPGGLRIVFFSDVHARTEWDTPLALARAAEAINRLKPDLVIGDGNLITDGFQSSAASVEARWDAYMKMHDALRSEVHVAIGNHDLVGAIPEDGSPASEDPEGVFRERIGVSRTYYSFDALGYHFVLLDSIQILGEKTKYQGLISVEQLEWLKEDLSNVPKARPIVIALHIPLMTSFYQATAGSTASALSGRVVVNNRDVLDACKDHSLLLVLQGHLHVAEMLRWRNTTYITGGAICGQWWRGPWKGTEEGFCSVTLDGDRVEWEYINYGWEARHPPGV